MLKTATTAYNNSEVNNMLNLTVTDFALNLKKFMDTVTANNEAVNISTDSGNVVLLSEFEYRSLLETLDIYSHPDYMQTIIDGINTPLSECGKEDDFEW